MSTRKNKMIAQLRALTPEQVAQGDRIELDNLDWARLVTTDEGVQVENEHGTIFNLGQLSEGELDVFIFEYDLPVKFDYLILTENNQWVSTGNYETQEQLDKEIALIQADYPDETLVVFKAKEMEKYTV